MTHVHSEPRRSRTLQWWPPHVSADEEASGGGGGGGGGGEGGGGGGGGGIDDDDGDGDGNGDNAYLFHDGLRQCLTHGWLMWSA